MSLEYLNNNNNNRRILCVGMCVLDVVHVCEQYPEEDTDRRCLHGYWQRGGNASNNCTVLRELQADCEFLGVLSDSPAFQFLKEDCRKRGIFIDNCPSATQDPPFSSVILSQESDSRTIIHSNSNFPILTYEYFKKVNLDMYHWVHFDARNPDETCRMITDILEYNKEHNGIIKISVELEKLRPDHLALTKHADLVFLGKDFAKFLEWNDPKTAVLKLRETIENKRAEIICPWGSEGSSCLTQTGDYYHVPPCPPTKIIDALGAGDTFCAAVIYALSIRGLDLRRAVAFGNRVAGFKLGHFGYDKIRECDVEALLYVG